MRTINRKSVRYPPNITLVPGGLLSTNPDDNTGGQDYRSPKNSDPSQSKLSLSVIHSDASPTSTAGGGGYASYTSSSDHQQYVHDHRLDRETFGVNMGHVQLRQCCEVWDAFHTRLEPSELISLQSLQLLLAEVGVYLPPPVLVTLQEKERAENHKFSLLEFIQLVGKYASSHVQYATDEQNQQHAFACFGGGVPSDPRSRTPISDTDSTDDATSPTRNNRRRTMHILDRMCLTLNQTFGLHVNRSTLGGDGGRLSVVTPSGAPFSFNDFTTRVMGPGTVDCVSALLELAASSANDVPSAHSTRRRSLNRTVPATVDVVMSICTRTGYSTEVVQALLPTCRMSDGMVDIEQLAMSILREEEEKTSRTRRSMQRKIQHLNSANFEPSKDVVAEGDDEFRWRNAKSIIMSTSFTPTSMPPSTASTQKLRTTARVATLVSKLIGTPRLTSDGLPGRSSPPSGLVAEFGRSMSPPSLQGLFPKTPPKLPSPKKSRRQPHPPPQSAHSKKRPTAPKKDIQKAGFMARTMSHISRLASTRSSATTASTSPRNRLTQPSPNTTIATMDFDNTLNDLPMVTEEEVDETSAKLTLSAGKKRSLKIPRVVEDMMKNPQVVYPALELVSGGSNQFRPSPPARHNNAGSSRASRRGDDPTPTLMAGFRSGRVSAASNQHPRTGGNMKRNGAYQLSVDDRKALCRFDSEGSYRPVYDEKLHAFYHGVPNATTHNRPPPSAMAARGQRTGERELGLLQIVQNRGGPVIASTRSLAAQQQQQQSTASRGDAYHRLQNATERSFVDEEALANRKKGRRATIRFRDELQFLDFRAL